MSEIKIEAYNPQWKEIFEQEENILSSIFQEKEPVIEHIGSTAVVGLTAKPIVDIMIGFKKLDTNEIVRNIEKLGYEHWYEDTFRHERLFFTKWNPGKKERLIHIHATTIGSNFWKNQILFRKKLRENPELATMYAEVKKELAVKFGSDRDGYTEAKTEFIRKALSQ